MPWLRKPLPARACGPFAQCVVCRRHKLPSMLHSLNLNGICMLRTEGRQWHTAEIFASDIFQNRSTRPERLRVHCRQKSPIYACNVMLLVRCQLCKKRLFSVCVQEQTRFTGALYFDTLACRNKPLRHAQHFFVDTSNGRLFQRNRNAELLSNMCCASLWAARPCHLHCIKAVLLK